MEYLHEYFVESKIKILKPVLSIQRPKSTTMQISYAKCFPVKFKP